MSSNAMLGAVAAGDLRRVRRLLGDGADPNEVLVDSGGVEITALRMAIRHRRSGAAALLLDVGADPDWMATGSSPTMHSALVGDVATLQLLVDRGADLQLVASDTGRTALHFAWLNNQPGCVKVLERAGCDVAAKDVYGCTGEDIPAWHLIVAVQAGDLGLARQVLNQGADPNALLQAMQGSTRTPDADEEQQSITKSTALVEAASRGSLKRGGPDWRGYLKLVVLLLERGANPDLPDSRGVTPLMAAACGGHVEVLRQLIEHGATLNPLLPVLSADGDEHNIQSTALIWAAEHGQLEAVTLLLDRGADPNLADVESLTPLMAAARSDELEVLQLLIESGASLDIEDCDIYWTAFHYACIHENPGCVEALVQAGCDVTIQCDEGLTGKELAEEYGRTEVVNCLTRMAKAAKNKKKRDRKRRQQIKAKQAAAVEQSNVAEPIKAELKLEPEPEPEPTDLAEPEAEITVLLLPDPVTAVEPS